MRPKISVLIALYNSERYLDKVLNSALSQTYPPHEIIVIDDGSTDGSPAILERYKGRVISKRIENSGSPSAPLNLALQMATGDYIAFLDHDDFWFKNTLERHVEFIRKFPDIGVFCSDFAVRLPSPTSRLRRNFDSVRSRKMLNFNSPLKVDPFALLLRENFAGISSNVVIKKDLVDKVGDFDNGADFSEDYDYLLRCAQRSNFVLISDLLVYKKTHESNITRNVLRMYQKHINVLNKVRRGLLLAKNEHLLNECDRGLAEHYYSLADQFYNINEFGRSFSAYQEAFKFSRTIDGVLYFAYKIMLKMARVLSFNKFRRENVKFLGDLR